MKAALLVLAAVLSCADATAATDLIHLEVHEPPVAGRKPLDLRVDEVERNASDSVIAVDFTSGASVPSSMFVMKAACAVTAARGERFFRSEPVPGPTTRYRLTFPHEGGGRGSDTVTIEQCRLVGF